jgi:hypothetical protein
MKPVDAIHHPVEHIYLNLVMVVLEPFESSVKAAIPISNPPA